MEARKTGPKGPRKGERVSLTGRVPKNHNDVYEIRRKQLGLSIGDFVALRLAQAEGLPIPEYINVIDINRNRPTEGDQGGSAMAI